MPWKKMKTLSECGLPSTSLHDLPQYHQYSRAPTLSKAIIQHLDTVDDLQIIFYEYKKEEDNSMNS